MTFFGFRRKMSCNMGACFGFFKNQNKHQVGIIFSAFAEKFHAAWIIVWFFLKTKTSTRLK